MKKSVVAIMYDFDKTLCTKDMQDYAFIPALGMTCDAFWREVNEMTDREEMDNILAYMFQMVQKASEKQIPITRETFHEMGSHVEYFPGVQTWFDRINAYCEELGITAEHYIVSSGIKEIIEGTEIAKYFKRIYACEYLYDEQGSIQWPKFAVNYTAKTQFLFRINKGILTIDSKSAEQLNQYTPEHARPVPFQNMIYIGDGLTDVPCMKLVKTYGGQSIAVYDQEKGHHAAQRLQQSDRVNFIAPADYSPDSCVEVIVKSIIKKIQATEEMLSHQ